MDATFPARDESFGPLIARLSETTEAKGGDNFISNEDSVPRILGELSRTVDPGGVYLGVGPDQNLSLIANTRPALAFVIDFRRRNLLLHLLHKACFALGANRVGYLNRLIGRNPGKIDSDASLDDLVAAFRRAPYEPGTQKERIETVRSQLQSLNVVKEDEWEELATIQTRLAGPGMDARFLALRMYPTLGQLVLEPDKTGKQRHFLAAEELYQTVKNLQTNDRLIPVVGDFAGRHTFATLAAWLRERKRDVTLFYVSDVEFFLLRNGKFPPYLDNLRALPWSPNGQIVRTSTREIRHPSRFDRDSSTTVVEPTARFLGRAENGRIKTVDDLFELGGTR